MDILKRLNEHVNIIGEGASDGKDAIAKFLKSNKLDKALIEVEKVAKIFANNGELYKILAAHDKIENTSEYSKECADLEKKLSAIIEQIMDFQQEISYLLKE